jgi:hypothetical protein
VHPAAFLGGHHVARDFCLDVVAAQQQVVRGIVLQPRERDGKAA